MSGSQALILLLFNQNEKITCKEIIEQTGLSDGEVKRQLVSLTLLEHQILLANADKVKSSQMMVQTETNNDSKNKVVKKNVTGDDIFEVNVGFKSKLRRIAINTLQKKETK